MTQVNVAILVTIFNIVISSSSTVQARNSNEKPPLPPLQIVTAATVAGNSKTQAIERKILTYNTNGMQLPGESREVAYKRNLNAISKLVDQVNGAEELERVAYWAIRTDIRNNPFIAESVDYYIFRLCLFALKKKYPKEARSRLYEIGSLINADSAPGLDVDEALDRLNSYRPKERAGLDVPCCYVTPQNHNSFGGRLSPELSAIDFNMTRLLRRAWYPYWTGKYRYWIECTFTLSPTGQISDLKTDVNNGVRNVPAAVIERGHVQIQAFLKSANLLNEMPKPKKAVQIQASFFD